MSDVLVTLLVVAAILLVVDLLFMGGGMTMTAMSGMAGGLAHPLVAGAVGAYSVRSLDAPATLLRAELPDWRSRARTLRP